MLRYGVLSYNKVHMNLDGNDFQNLGDWVQTIAMEELYKEWGIDNYIFVNRDDAMDYDGDYVVVPYNGFNSLVHTKQYEINAFPLSQKIIPLFFGMHFHDDYIPTEMREQLIHFGPVGCRDEETMCNMRSHGVYAYLSGCVTALFTRRNIDDEKQKKVLLVDAPDEIESYMPLHLKENMEYMTHIYQFDRMQGENYTTEKEASDAYQETRRLLQYYKDYASLVVTQRLHVAAPCMAMGIPVILARRDGFSGRYAWIDKWLPLYTKDKWKNIDWNPGIVEYEEEKKFIKEFLRNRLKSTYEQYRDMVQISSFYENRANKTYCENVISALDKIDLSVYNTYAIWGVIQEAQVLKHLLSRKYPNLKLVAVYDKNIKGDFEGYQIQSSDAIINDDVLYFVMPRSAFDYAKRKLDDLGNKYVLAEFRDYQWRHNL